MTETTTEACAAPATPADAEVRAGIERLRREKNAVILAHYYQDGAIQDLADFVGDSLDLSRRAAETDADMIVFCGVRFMGEVAKILSPEKKVVIPDMEAGCSLEEACRAEDLAAFRAEHPDHVVVTYINSSVEVKALSDYVVTSSSALDIIEAIPEDRPILFTPDRHLGSWLKRRTGRKMDLWPGACIVHEEFSADALASLRKKHPGAPVAAHPECPFSILEMADFVGSTKQILDFVLSRPEDTFIIATEQHIIHQMKKAAPDKTFIPAPGMDGDCKCATCPYMALNTMEKLFVALRDEKPEILIDEELRKKALRPLQRMLDISAAAAARRAAA
ncbi:MAG TPA: quinolinate synthase NadA [Thermopetrobacter sp.]|nr:quinolinate synthase NadA [Thermopetrobacter sp.]